MNLRSTSTKVLVDARDVLVHLGELAHLLLDVADLLLGPGEPPALLGLVIPDRVEHAGVADQPGTVLKSDASLSVPVAR